MIVCDRPEACKTRKVVVGLDDGQMFHQPGIVHGHVDESLHRGFQREVEDVLVALIIHVVKGQLVLLAGQPHGRENDLDPIAQARQRLGLGDLAHKQIVDLVPHGGRQKGAWLRQSLWVSRQGADPVPSPLEFLDDKASQIAGRTGDQHIHGSTPFPS